MASLGDLPPNPSDKTADESLQWERKVIHDLAFAAIKEQRNSRRWGYVFKGLIALYFIALLLLAMPQGQHQPSQEHTALIDIQGVIAADTETNATDITKSIRHAFDNEQAQGLILRMNTPGGSPVQSGMIYDEIQRLKQKRPDFPVYAVIEDICASGGYYIAAAATKIYADKASIVGSIGVRMDSFGFQQAIKQLGIERRSLTAGENKAFLDPFLPMQKKDVQHAQLMLDNVHQQFIHVVKTGRGEKLVDNPDLFSGLFWSGEQALPLGLVDGLASSDSVARDLIGNDIIINYTPKPDYLDQFANRFASSLHQIGYKLTSIQVY
ncbi:MAG TPA: S49 family peptidase [Gammaproteobacteria bacterium]|nr:S49 family peptidase [Gammaproteobacteria bacterium]HAU06772.1 S49 family peptidase [Gammaproteobacteria bacterium]